MYEEMESTRNIQTKSLDNDLEPAGTCLKDHDAIQRAIPTGTRKMKVSGETTT